MKNQNGVLYYGRVIIFGESRSNEKTAYRVRLGNIAADMLITNVNVFHLSDGTLEQCDIAIGNGKIAGLGNYKNGKKIIDGSGLYAVPGFIDSHVHWESSHLLPQEYEKLVLQERVVAGFCTTWRSKCVP